MHKKHYSTVTKNIENGLNSNEVSHAEKVTLPSSVYNRLSVYVFRISYSLTYAEINSTSIEKGKDIVPLEGNFIHSVSQFH